MEAINLKENTYSFYFNYKNRALFIDIKNRFKEIDLEIGGFHVSDNFVSIMSWVIRYHFFNGG